MYPIASSKSSAGPEEFELRGGISSLSLEKIPALEGRRCEVESDELVPYWAMGIEEAMIGVRSLSRSLSLSGRVRLLFRNQK